MQSKIGEVGVSLPLHTQILSLFLFLKAAAAIIIIVLRALQEIDDCSCMDGNYIAMKQGSFGALNLIGGEIERGKNSLIHN